MMGIPEPNFFDSEYVYIGEDGRYHIKEDAPEDIKKSFYDFFAPPEPDDNGLITLT